MSKLRIVYIISLVILGVLVAITVFRLMGGDGGFSTVSREQILETEDGWIIQFDIFNHEDEDIRYTIEVAADGKIYREGCQLSSGVTFNYIHHILSSELTEGKVSISIYKEGEDTPLEQGIYCLKKKP